MCHFSMDISDIVPDATRDPFVRMFVESCANLEDLPIYEVIMVNEEEWDLFILKLSRNELIEPHERTLFVENPPKFPVSYIPFFYV